MAKTLENDQQVIAWTKAVAEGSADTGKLAEALLSADRESITAKASVRYLLQIKKWDLTPTSLLAPAMDHLFANYEGKPQPEPEVYRAQTRDLIKEIFGFECVEAPLAPAPEPKVAEEKPVKKKAPAKKPAPKRAAKPKASNPDAGDISTDIDTTGASSRLKKVIAIQRGGKA